MNSYYSAITNTYTTNPAYQEILKLDKMLTEANIPHTLDRLYDGWILCYPNFEDRVMDAIEHNGSYGNSCDELEIMSLLTPEENLDEVLGYLTAEDVFERIRKHYAGEWDDYIKSLPVPITEEDPEEPSVEATDPIPMTPEEFATQMEKTRQYYYIEQDDEEEAHIAMDGIMCNLLRQLGYGEGINVFSRTPKWYS